MDKATLIKIAQDAIASDDEEQIINALRLIASALPEEYTDKALQMFLVK